jgi:hypothetical protein
MHAAGIEFDDTFFVGQTAEANGIVVGIVLRTPDYPDTSLQSIATTL